jgi:CheY-like chemotaxis protein
VVEDEPAIRALVQDTLRRQGYTVLEARHGVEALMAGTRYLGQIHLLITDVVMPQMSGSDVAKRLIVERPQLKVLYSRAIPMMPSFITARRMEAPFFRNPFRRMPWFSKPAKCSMRSGRTSAAAPVSTNPIPALFRIVW